MFSYSYKGHKPEVKVSEAAPPVKALKERCFPDLFQLLTSPSVPCLGWHPLVSASLMQSSPLRTSVPHPLVPFSPKHIGFGAHTRSRMTLSWDLWLTTFTKTHFPNTPHSHSPRPRLGHTFSIPVFVPLKRSKTLRDLKYRSWDGFFHVPTGLVNGCSDS